MSLSFAIGVTMFEQTRNATLRTYGELRNRGQSDPRAFETAVGIFQHRFPEIPSDDAKFVVADWICEALGQ